MFRTVFGLSCAHHDRLASFRRSDHPKRSSRVGQLPENGHRSGLHTLVESRKYLELGDAVCGLQRTRARLDEVNRQSRRGNWTHIDHARMARVILKSLLKNIGSDQ